MSNADLSRSDGNKPQVTRVLEPFQWPASAPLLQELGQSSKPHAGAAMSNSQGQNEQQRRTSLQRQLKNQEEREWILKKLKAREELSDDVAAAIEPAI
jgi:hypothetical protein